MTLIPGLALLQLPLADGFDMHGDFGAGWWIAMMLGMLLFWGLIIGAIVWVVRDLMSHRATQSDLATPDAVLDQRFAAGEISSEEYRERKAVLAGERPPKNASGD